MQQKIKTRHRILQHSAILIIFMAVLFLIYFPIVQGHYFYAEDYSYAWTNSTAEKLKDLSYFSFVRAMIWEGRPLETLYAYLVFNKYINLVKSIEAGNLVLLIGIIGMGLLAYTLYLAFKANGFKFAHAFLLSILICTLPPLQALVSRIYILVFVYCVLLSVSSALILFKVVFKEDRAKKTNIAIAVLTSIVLLIMSLSIYQPAAMTFWAMAAIPLIKKDEDFTEKWYLPFTIYFFSGVISIFIYRVIVKKIGFLLNTGLSNRGELIYRSEIYDSMIWFKNHPLYEALNLWNVFPSNKIVLFVSIIILTGIIYSFLRDTVQIVQKKKKVSILFRYIIILLIVPLSHIVHIVVRIHEQVSIHRYLVGLEITLLLLFYWGLTNIADFFQSILNFPAKLKDIILTTVLIILTVVTAFLANQNVEKYFAGLHTDELQYVKNAIQEYGGFNLPKTSKIYIIRPDKKTQYEFGYMNSMSIGQSVSMVRMALYELGINSDIDVQHVTSDMQLPSDNSVLVIDMRKFQTIALKSIEFVEFPEGY